VALPKYVYIIGGDRGIYKMFHRHPDYEVTEIFRDADLYCFTGGADVSPDLYGAKAHPTTGANPERDRLEQMEFAKIVETGKPMVGICRGSQFLCVMNGGSLYQDVDKHAIWGTHDMAYFGIDGTSGMYETTSTHHQMQNPFTSKSEHEIWGAAYLCTYRDSEKIERKQIDFDKDHPDVEIVYWPETKSLGFQGHPEYDSKECRDLFFICLDRALKRV
jgi:GMP synthase-like glutamine amidotransferase